MIPGRVENVCCWTHFTNVPDIRHCIILRTSHVHILEVGGLSMFKYIQQKSRKNVNVPYAVDISVLVRP